jgi:hypothetical protein
VECKSGFELFDNALSNVVRLLKLANIFPGSVVWVDCVNDLVGLSLKQFNCLADSFFLNREVLVSFHRFSPVSVVVSVCL